MHTVTQASRASLVSRGRFLKVFGSSLLWPWLELDGLAAAVTDVVSRKPAQSRTRVDVVEGSAEWFRRQLSTTFLVRTDTGGVVALRLVSVVAGPVSSQIEQFSLIFHARDEATAPDGMFACEHPTLGHLDLFIVPIGATNSRPRVYEACFSRFLSSGPEG